jgi:hypothetical protein
MGCGDAPHGLGLIATGMWCPAIALTVLAGNEERLRAFQFRLMREDYFYVNLANQILQMNVALAMLDVSVRCPRNPPSLPLPLKTLDTAA